MSNMAAANRTLLIDFDSVLNNVTSGAPTVLVRDKSRDIYGILGNDNSTFRNVSTSSSIQETGTDISTWLSVRLIIIVCVVLGLIFLSWGSYTLHRRCYGEAKKQKYHKALLI